MKIRIASITELTQFELLWKEYLEENFKNGDSMLPSKNNLKSFRQIARQYIENPGLGVVLMSWEKAIPTGVLMWGCLPALGFETIYGKTAHGWGTYVRPSYRGEGLSAELRQVARQFLKLLKVKTLQGAVVPGNLPAESSVESLGFTKTVQLVVWDLEKD